MNWADWMIILFTAVWIGEFLFFKSRSKAEGDEKRSFPLILTSVLLVIFTAAVTREFAFWTYEAAVIQGAGVFCYGSGIMLRYWGILHLGRQFTRDVQVRDGDTLVGTGPYRILSHPLYSGLLFTVMGFTLYTGSILASILVLFTALPALIRRIKGEETLLIQAFGIRYQEWMKSRYRLIPFIY
ncbi:methyltransferase family protein [Salisediminibacterium beveridgei]|uniref:Isoprenylcysteine Carboxyl Methyltransferase n=1 Tax=Salisediminibacterium beveridgei TaxID=632773 RepID=A0A1D7QSK9_9BACI|nr:isoprenylcysteine carboxylmethyltransferase family protein [Salisediminibacterium beveridgei]AOM81971.1 Isoprenylcysteine Carboxyl Methyltransferase [Salisediminibacterium beveridgei]